MSENDKQCCQILSSLENADKPAKVQQLSSKRNYTCCECLEIIEAGTAYHLETCIIRGKLGMYRTCPTCMSIRQVFFPRGWTFKHVREDLMDHLRANHGRIKLECLQALSPDAQDVVEHMILQIKGE